MKRIATNAFTLLILVFAFRSFAADLTDDDRKLASTLVAKLAAEEFDERTQAETKLKILVMEDQQKAGAWDHWLESVSKRTKDKEVLARLPSHVAFRNKLCGRYRAIGSPGEIQYTMEFLPDGTYQMFTGKNNQLRGKGKYTVTDKAQLNLQGTVTPFTNTGDEAWTCSASLKDDVLTTIAKSDDTDGECRWKKVSIEHEQKESTDTNTRK